MKALLLASALAFCGSAAIAQTMTPPPSPPADAPMAPQTPPAPPAADTPAPPADAPTPPAAPMATDAPAAPAGSAPAADAADPAGGYAPAGPPMQGTLAPGQTPVFQPSVAPNVAFPPPAPLTTYPICKKGQYDNCRQRGG